MQKTSENFILFYREKEAWNCVKYMSWQAWSWEFFLAKKLGILGCDILCLFTWNFVFGQIFHLDFDSRNLLQSNTICDEFGLLLRLFAYVFSSLSIHLSHSHLKNHCFILCSVILDSGPRFCNIGPRVHIETQIKLSNCFYELSHELLGNSFNCCNCGFWSHRFYI